MKKSFFTALCLGVIGVLLFGLGMSMCMLPEWGLYNQGIIVGIIGLLFLVAMIIIYRIMEHKKPIHLNGKIIARLLIGIVGALIFGTGMCLVMVYNFIIYGIIAGVLGILILLSLIPLCVGFQD